MATSPNNLDASFEAGCRALGEVVYFFQQLERNLREAVSFLINPDDAAAADIVVCEQSLKQLFGLAYSLFKLYLEFEDSQNSKQWRSILARTFKAETRRNGLLHSTFGASVGETAVFSRSKVTAKFNAGLSEKVEALDNAAMADYRQSISFVANDIQDFMFSEMEYAIVEKRRSLSEQRKR